MLLFRPRRCTLTLSCINKPMGCFPRGGVCVSGCQSKLLISGAVTNGYLDSRDNMYIVVRQVVCDTSYVSLCISKRRALSESWPYNCGIGPRTVSLCVPYAYTWTLVCPFVHSVPHVFDPQGRFVALVTGPSHYSVNGFHEQLVRTLFSFHPRTITQRTAQ